MRLASLGAGCLVLIALLSSVSGARPQDDEKNAPETLIKSAKFLEEKPFDSKAKDVRAWALKWLIATDKVSVTVCTLLVSGIDKKYKYSGEIFGQYTIGMAAFKLSKPEKASDEDGAQLAGIESALTSYTAMVKEQPKAKDTFLDELLAKRSSGELITFVKENNCKEKK